MSPTEKLRAEVALGCRVLASAGHTDMIWGHASARDPAGRGAWMKASGWGLEETTPERVILIDDAGSVREGNGQCHAEYPIHTEIFRTRLDVGAVVHTHPTYSIAFMSTNRPLRPISHDGTWLTPPELPRFTETGNLIRTPELGARLAACLGDRHAVLIPNHGIVTVGPDIPYAVMTAVLLERSCRLQLLADAAGGIATWSNDEEAVSKRAVCWSDSQIHGGWAYLCRRLDANTGTTLDGE
jgi:ribulose-5-phosphate 4-epimerase/fuculose-1-phosphate aldolase